MLASEIWETLYAVTIIIYYLIFSSDTGLQRVTVDCD